MNTMMERRAVQRFTSAAPVRVTVLKTGAVLRGRAADMSGRGMRLVLDAPVVSGAMLQIEIEDALLLGEAVYCRREGAAFATGIQIEHALYDVPRLAAEAARLLQT